MNYWVVTFVVVSAGALFSILSEGFAEVGLDHQPLVNKNDVLQQVRYASKDSGISAKLITSEQGFFTGGISPVTADGTGPEPSSLGLILWSERDMTINSMFLCTANECLWNEARGPGPLHATGAVPQFYYFSGLGQVDWDDGEEVHMWALASEGVDDPLSSDTRNAVWLDLGLSTVKPCETYGHWCFPS